uniref:PPIase cyclophilin-type domain-containing protein n=1 Tax=Chromera velia CCMP2878 TaxID=1169474 RepID=A0A0G4F373_9ALVE|eukprot:Cvel_14896.t1-p1 / transcript=Cvel_14896.t1 / gene=Cvel_14896 / organism=Chromera_velia_CCMP2878 / gene_product=Peptidyl-prolyl cis-trans isomerase B, putative / transcript_product=Peptidyl-prolyl cis-trans isomerase B, putative / location=Cvel_scaffold1079:7085-10690(-) / protein_length=430 / sequence_SO=supercontig / SO=protein_coding / is_pseudo=false
MKRLPELWLAAAAAFLSVCPCAAFRLSESSRLLERGGRLRSGTRRGTWPASALGLETGCEEEFSSRKEGESLSFLSFDEEEGDRSFVVEGRRGGRRDGLRRAAAAAAAIGAWGGVQVVLSGAVPLASAQDEVFANNTDQLLSPLEEINVDKGIPPPREDWILLNETLPEPTERVWMEFEKRGVFLGRINITLYGKIVPKAADNFASLCRGDKGVSYENSTMFRVLRDINLQFGDIGDEGRGLRGRSSFGAPFARENFRIRHSVVGHNVVSMIRSGQPPYLLDSRFLITRNDIAEYADDRFVAVGRVTGGEETLATLDQVKTRGVGNRPRQPVRIRACGVYDDPVEPSLRSVYDETRAQERSKAKKDKETETESEFQAVPASSLQPILIDKKKLTEEDNRRQAELKAKKIQQKETVEKANRFGFFGITSDK